MGDLAEWNVFDFKVEVFSDTIDLLLIGAF